MRTTVVDVTAKLMVTNGIVQVNEGGAQGQSIHAWLKHHMEHHPAKRYELVVGTNVTIELGTGDASRPDLTQTIIAQFNQERMNFGEELRVRLITTSPAVQVIQETAPASKKPFEEDKAQEAQVPEKAIWEVTRMSKSELEKIVEQSLGLEQWKVVVAYCELQRRSRVVEPRLTNSFLMFAKVQNFSDADSLIAHVVGKLGYTDYLSLLKRLNELERTTHKTSPMAELGHPEPSSSGVATVKMKSDEPTPWYRKWYVWVFFVAWVFVAIIPDDKGDGLPEYDTAYSLEGNIECYECDAHWSVKITDESQAVIYSWAGSGIQSCTSDITYNWDKSSMTLRIFSVRNDHISHQCKNQFIGSWQWSEGCFRK